MKLNSTIFCISIMLALSIEVFGQNNIVSSDSKISNDFLLASSKFMNGDYTGCIPLYKSVLKRDSLLTKNYWYVLIDNLGMAYGITGDNNSCEQIFKYGFSKDSKYPMFYYCMACLCAQKDDLDECINYLKSAYKYKKNVLVGEIFPDPAIDDSFQKYLNNDKFTATLRDLKKQ